MSKGPNNPSVPALEALGQQFAALEASAQEPQTRPSARLLVATLAVIVVVAGSLALSPAIDATAERVADVATVIENPAPARQAHPGTQTHLEKPAPELVLTCHERLRRSPTNELCQAIILLDRGQLTPGDYTNQELHEELDRLLTAAGRLPAPRR